MKTMLRWMWVAMVLQTARAVDELGLHPDLTLASKYMAHGFNVNGEHASLQPSLLVDTKVPGLQFFAWAALPVNRDFRAKDEFDYLVKYGRTFLADSALAVNLHGYADYWIYPNSAADGADDLKGWKFSGGASLPELLPLGPANLVPSYTYYFWTPQDDGGFEDGGVHEFFLGYNPPLRSFAPVAGDRTLNLGASLNYHDGVFGVEPGWSHATAHVSTSLEIATLKISPSLNYQWSFEDTIDPEDEVWAAVSVARDF